MHVVTPVRHDIVLIGGGHCHALVLKALGMAPIPGARLTLISPRVTSIYSGMLPGVLAGHYSRDESDIDLVRLARFANARLILASVEQLDLTTQRVHLPCRPSIPFDTLSIDTGLSDGMGESAAALPGAWPIRPFDPLLEGWAAFLDQAMRCPQGANAVVIGAGLGGIEMACAIAYRLRTLKTTGEPSQVQLIEQASEILPAGSAGLRRSLKAALHGHGVDLLVGDRPVSLEANRLRLNSGAERNADFVILAGGGKPGAWLADTGLTLKDGFVAIDNCLRSISHASVFAVGDVAQFMSNPLPKSGVFAVRQASVLTRNLRETVCGSALARFRPQRSTLKLISLGDRAALAEKWGLTVEGPGIWTWKSHVDRAFMAKLSDFPNMQPDVKGTAASFLFEPVTQAETPLCGGCGSKLGGAVLKAALAELAPPERSDVLLGPGDDAAILQWGEGPTLHQVLTTDHFRAFTDDPYRFGRIATQHALGDIWAMGADPQAALINLTLPPMSARKQATTAAEILAGVEAALRAAGADLVGGHSAQGAELALGVTLTGLLPDAIRMGLSRAQPGDRLVLTKPIGSGTLLAANMQCLAKGVWVEGAFVAMDQSLRPIATALRFLAHAMTDVSGFGLAGHLQRLIDRSGQDAELDLNMVPFLAGASTLATQGVRSSLFAENFGLAAAMVASDEIRQRPEFTLLFDPQTAGGLLAAVPDSALPQLVAESRKAAIQIQIIGTLTPSRAHPTISVKG